MSDKKEVLDTEKDALNIVLEKANDQLVKLQNLNSEFPATREFLEARRLHNVSQLDARGRKEIVEYLENIILMTSDGPQQ